MILFWPDPRLFLFISRVFRCQLQNSIKKQKGIQMKPHVNQDSAKIFLNHHRYHHHHHYFVCLFKVTNKEDGRMNEFGERNETKTHLNHV